MDREDLSVSVVDDIVEVLDSFARQVSTYAAEYSQIAGHEVKPRQTVVVVSLVRLSLTLPVIHARVDVTAP